MRRREGSRGVPGTGTEYVLTDTHHDLATPSPNPHSAIHYPHSANAIRNLTTYPPAERRTGPPPRPRRARSRLPPRGKRPPCGPPRPSRRADRASERPHRRPGTPPRRPRPDHRSCRCRPPPRAVRLGRGGGGRRGRRGGRAAPHAAPPADATAAAVFLGGGMRRG